MPDERLRSQLHEWLDTHRDEGIGLLGDMIRARSIQGEERGIQDLLADYLRGHGMEVDLWEPDGRELGESPLFHSPRERFAGSPNLVGRLPGSGGGRSLILNGHIDVVPVGDPSQWRHDPWAAEVVDGRMYGRGASDMKGGLAAGLLALTALEGIGVRLAGDVLVESVIEEESGGAGTLAAALRGYRADGAIIPEPTDMAVFPKQQGSLWFRATVLGRGAHGGTRYEGVSAIEKAYAVITAIRQVEEGRNRALDEPLYAGTPIPVPINVGVIRGGEWPSSVPDRVVLEGRMGVAPGEPVEKAQADLREGLEGLAKEDAWFETAPVELEWFGARWLPNDLDPGAELVQVLLDAAAEVLGAPPALAAAPWGTDAGLMQAAAGVPAIVFGPGTTSTAHQPDEYIELSQLFAAAEIMALMFARWCGRG